MDMIDIDGQVKPVNACRHYNTETLDRLIQYEKLRFSDETVGTSLITIDKLTLGPGMDM